MGKPAKIEMRGTKPWCKGCTLPCETVINGVCRNPDPEKNCLTCRWSTLFERTPSGRLKRGTIGRCSYEVVWPKLPFFLGERLPRKSGGNTPSNCWGRGITPDDGKDCECWERHPLNASVP